MKIISLNTKITYEIEPNKSGENTGLCPECSHLRKNQNKKKKCFSWNNEKKTGYCNNCNVSFVEFKNYKTEKEYSVPEWKNKTELTDKAAKYFEGRMIRQKTVRQMKIYSDNEYMPQFQKETEVICFPYFRDKKLINVKYRGAEKSFKLYKDAELIFYNLESIIGAKEIIIVEGEFDALSFIEIGFSNVISVPNGGGHRNMEYLDGCIELFDNVERIYLATDNDIKGIELREELLRRLGQEKCLIVNFKECKDANEVLCKKGGNELKQNLLDAIEIPVDGIVNLNSHYDKIYDLFLHGIQPGKSLGIIDIDNLITWETGRLAVWTGIPGHGKSEVVDWFNVILNIRYGWKTAYFSPENWPVEYHYSKLVSKVYGRQFKAGYIDPEWFDKIYDYVYNNYYFIYPEDDLSINNIIEKAKYLVKKAGIKIFVIDPYNKIEHLRDRNESETEYISRFLDKLTLFAKRYDVLIHLVAHPRKMDKDGTKKFERPTLYDINGSANFYNKCDYGISVYRDREKEITEFHFLKIKFKHLGEGGIVERRYNYNNGRYEDPNVSIDFWNNNNYLIPEIKEPKKSFYEVEKEDDFFSTIEPNRNFETEPPF